MNRRKAVITGGSRGIGFAVAKTLVKNNFDIFLTGRNQDRLDQAVEELNQYGRVFSYAADMTDPKSPEKIILQAATLLGGIDLLVNNAGTSSSLSVEGSTLREWDDVMAVNARSPLFLCQQALPYLRKSQSPAVIQIGSVVAVKGYADQAIYSASKHALAGFTKAFAREVYKEGIRVHMVMPGGVGTEMITSMRPDIDPAELISPEEIADIVLFLVQKRGRGVIDEIHIRRETKTPWE